MNNWTRELVQARQQLEVSISKLAVSRASVAARAHLQLVIAVSRFERNDLEPELLKLEMQAINESLVEVAVA